MEFGWTSIPATGAFATRKRPKLLRAAPPTPVILTWMRLGSLTLTSNLFLSPLAGYTNLPFRLVVREIGGVGLCTTDLVNARSLLEKNPTLSSIKNLFRFEVQILL